MIGFNSTFMIVLPRKERSSRSRSAGCNLPSSGTAQLMVANNAWPVCSELLTGARSPTPLVHHISCHLLTVSKRKQIVAAAGVMLLQG